MAEYVCTFRLRCLKILTYRKNLDNRFISCASEICRLTLSGVRVQAKVHFFCLYYRDMWEYKFSHQRISIYIRRCQGCFLINYLNFSAPQGSLRFLLACAKLGYEACTCISFIRIIHMLVVEAVAPEGPDAGRHLTRHSNEVVTCMPRHLINSD